MIKTQRIIKYCAIVFALYLIFNIIFGILYGVMSIDNIFSSDDNVGDLNNVDIDISNNVKYLDIDVSNVSIDIKNGESFKIETDNNKVDITSNNDKIIIRENSSWLFSNENKNVVIYIPKDLIFQNVNIENGAGKVSIEELNSKKLYLDLGAGKVTINNINISLETEIDSGAGEFIINNGTLTNLDLDMGVGKVYIKSLINGDSEIDAGVGETVLDLIGTINNYKIRIDKGIGDTSINGNKISDSKYHGNGNNVIDIDGGIGKFTVNFVEE